MLEKNEKQELILEVIGLVGLSLIRQIRKHFVNNKENILLFIEKKYTLHYSKRRSFANNCSYERV